MDATDPAVVVALDADDAAVALPLSVEAGWNQVEADWRFMLAGGGGIAAVDERGAPVGTAIVLPLAPALRWISMVIVTAARRGEGIGDLLMRRSLMRVGREGAAAGLDATELGRPVYARLGFRDAWTFARRRLERPPEADPPPGVVLEPAGEADLASIAALDGAATGFARAALLAHLRARAPALAWVARRAGETTGFALGRDGRLASQLGPVVAGDEGVARALVARAAAACGGPAILDVPDARAGFAAWLDAAGAPAGRRFTRMARGAAGLADDPRLFAIAGPELG